MQSLIFDWDDANIDHIARHNVQPEEAEEVLLGDPLDLAFSDDEGNEERWEYVGETDSGRILFVVITLRDKKVRVVTAFDAEKQDKLLYLAIKAGQHGGIEDS